MNSVQYSEPLSSYRADERIWSFAEANAEAILKENNWGFKTTISVHKFIRHRIDTNSTHICCARMQNSFCRFNILEIMIPSFSLCKCKPREWKPKEEISTCTRKKQRRKICGNKINYGMISVSFAKIGIKFFKFPLLVCMCM